MLYSSLLFSLPVGAGAVIPVSEGSDGGHCWPVGVAAHRKSTKPLRTTLQLLSSLMGSLGGESQGWWGLRYLASLPRAVYHVGRSKYVAHAVVTFISLDAQRETTINVWKLIDMCSHPDSLTLSMHGCSISSLSTPWPSWIWHPVQLNERVSDDGELGVAQAGETTLNVNFCPAWLELTLLDMFWSFPALQPK